LITTKTCFCSFLYIFYWFLDYAKEGFLKTYHNRHLFKVNYSQTITSSAVSYFNELVIVSVLAPGYRWWRPPVGDEGEGLRQLTKNKRLAIWLTFKSSWRAIRNTHSPIRPNPLIEIGGKLVYSSSTYHHQWFTLALNKRI